MPIAAAIGLCVYKTHAQLSGPMGQHDLFADLPQVNHDNASTEMSWLQQNVSKHF